MANVGYIQNWRAGRLKFSHLILVACLFSAAFLLYLPSELGAALTIPPDSSEYSICLVNLFEHGKFGFTLNGEWYPSRYSPWFSLTCLTPAYLLSGGNALCFHWAILAFSLVLLVLIFEFGRRVGLGWAAPVPPLLLMFLPDFVFYSRVVMTEIPYTALLAVNTLLFARFAAARSHSPRFCFCAGLLVAWLGMVRMTGLPMILAFVVVLLLRRESWRSFLWRCLLIAAPVVASVLISLIYNRVVFGSFFRSGYKYWASVPCDFPQLMFNLANIENVVYVMTHTAIGMITIAVCVLTVMFFLLIAGGRFGGVQKNRWFLAAASYLILQTIILVALYGGYYWADTRFFLPVAICFLPFAFYAIRMFSEFALRRYAQLGLLLAILGVLMAFLVSNAQYWYVVKGRKFWLCSAINTASALPRESVIVQDGDPLILDYFALASDNVALVPFTRQFDYASHMVAPSPIGGVCDPPSSGEQRIIGELVDKGICKLPFKKTFFEDPEFISQLLRTGKRVFLQMGKYGDAFFRDPDIVKNILRRNGMSCKIYSRKTIKAIHPNAVRRFFDDFVLLGVFMGEREEITIINYELSLTDSSKDDSSNLAGHEDS